MFLVLATTVAIVTWPRESAVADALSLPRRQAAASSSGVRRPLKIQAAAGEAAASPSEGGEGTATIPNEVL